MTQAGNEASGGGPGDIVGAAAGALPREAPSSAATSAPVGKPVPEKDQELDLWWGGYSARTMLPSLLICMVLSVGIIAAGVYLHREHSVGAALARYEVYAVLALLWACQLLRFVYRVVFYSYRLTTHRLFWTQGPLSAAAGPIHVGDVRQVLVVQSWAERRVGIGHVYVLAREPGCLIFQGVMEPRRVADLIERVAKRKRGE